jgi:CHAD domain-containing protein
VESGELMFGAGTDPGQISAALADRYRVAVAAPSSGSWICLDTADWRLHRAGLSLTDTRCGRYRGLELVGRERQMLTGPAPARQWPHRLKTVPPSLVRDQIASAVGVRALLPLAEVEVRSVGLRVLDEQDKTRVRVRVDQQRLFGERRVPLPLRVVVAPLRGYERDGQRCVDLLREAVPPLSDLGNAAAAALSAAGHLPGAPAVQPPALDPQQPAAASLARVLRYWMDVIDSVQPGVLADVDPEFLHELRTSVRGTRSLLRLGAGLASDSPLAGFATEFAWLGRLTAPLRDLDVALLEVAGTGETDLAGLENLEPLQRLLTSQRRRALTAVRTGLQSPRGTELSTRWRAALDTLAMPELPGPPTHDAAAALARSAYRRIVKAAASVSEQTHPDELHRLRRRCKRMRYLLDAYAPVFSPTPHRQVLSALKRLQDCLGEIQDVDVQRRQLAEGGATLSRRGADSGALLAIGALRDRTLRRDTAAREVLTPCLARFCAPKMRRRVASLGAVGA